jgi:hypothetical protein
MVEHTCHYSYHEKCKIGGVKSTAGRGKARSISRVTEAKRLEVWLKQ